MAETVPFAPGLRARVTEGPGPGVLWIHGYTLDSSVWHELWSLLPGATHYGIDLPGHGTSAPLAAGTKLAELGHDLRAACSEQGIRHVVGLSLGSMVALELAIRAPIGLDTVTLAAPALAGGPVEHAVGLRYRELSALFRRCGPGPWMTELWMRSPPDTFAHTGACLRASLERVVGRHRWNELAGNEVSVSNLARQPQDPRGLAASTARPLFLVGEHELPAFRHTAAILAEVRRDARTAELAGAGHLCLLAAPRAAAALLAAHWAPFSPGP